jgi:DnaJ-class molecular chaperone
MPSKAQARSEELLDEPPTSINPYQVLDVEKDATPDKIKSAYRKAALQSHPGMINKCTSSERPCMKLRTDQLAR